MRFLSGHPSFELTWRDDRFTPSQLQAQIWNKTDLTNPIGFWWTAGHIASGSNNIGYGSAAKINSIGSSCQIDLAVFSTKNRKDNTPSCTFWLKNNKNNTSMTLQCCPQCKHSMFNVWSTVQWVYVHSKYTEFSSCLLKYSIIKKVLSIYFLFTIWKKYIKKI
jgi:hypothetical protein